MTSFSLLDVDQRYMIDSDGNIYGPKAILKPTPRVHGKYHQVTIGQTGKHYVHRLVATTFIPNPDGKPDVAHGDGNGLNNPAWNLRWATEKENMADTKLHGTSNCGGRHGHAKLTAEAVEYIRSCRGQYRGVQRDLAEVFDVSESVISAIIHGNAWKT